MPTPPPPIETRWEPGKSGNPGGRPASRNRLTARFLNDLADDFEANGKEAIQKCRETKPDAYIKAIAALCPKEIELKRPLEEMATDELISALNALTSYLASQTDQPGAGTPGEREPPGELPAIQ